MRLRMMMIRRRQGVEVFWGGWGVGGLGLEVEHERGGGGT